MSVWAPTFKSALLHQRLELHHGLWLAAVLAFAVLATMMRAWRLQLLVSTHARVGWFRAFCITQAHKLACVLVPVGGAELLRLFWLHRWCRLTTGTGAATVVNDRMLQFGGAAVFLTSLAAGNSILGAGGGGWALTAAAGGTGSLLALLIVGVILLPRVLRGAGVQKWMPAGASRWLLAQSHDFEKGRLHRIGNRGMAIGIGLSLGAFVADALMLTTLFASLGMTLPIVPSLTVCLMLVPGGLLPSPGGMGVVELIGTAGLRGGGLQAASAAAGVLAWHLAGIAVTFALGGAAIVLLGLPKRTQ